MQTCNMFKCISKYIKDITLNYMEKRRSEIMTFETWLESIFYASTL